MSSSRAKALIWDHSRKTHRGVELKVREFLILAQDGRDQSASMFPSYFAPSLVPCE